jgi:xylan 1,4-beta-xylosidase
MPSALASGDTTTFWYKMNNTPPKDYGEWRAFIEAVVAHFTERYGQRRVKRWLFEVWNEPDLANEFWTGDFDEYLKLYTASAAAVKAVCPDYQVGGPAGSWIAWNLPLLRICKERGVPVDFLSVHAYPVGEYYGFPNRRNSPHAPGMCMIDLFRRIREETNQAGFGAVPVVCTEFNTLTCDAEGKPQWVGSTDVTRLYSAAAACHYAVGVDPYVDVFTWWVASDVFFEGGPHLQVFGDHNQYYGMVTINGTPKPAFHAFRYLGRLQGPCLEVTLDAPPPAQAGLRATREPDCVRMLLWNFQIPQEPGQVVWRDVIRLPESLFGPAARIRVTSAQVRAGMGSAYEAWESWGRPVSLTRLEEEALVAASQPEHRVRILAAAGGCVEIPVELQRDEILFLEIRPNAEAVGAGPLGEDLLKLEAGLGNVGAKSVG